jgi:Tfp pilus assembly protein PilN
MSIGVGIELSAEGAQGVVVEVDRAHAPKVLAMASAAGNTASVEGLAAVLGSLRVELRIRQPVVLGLPATSAIVAGVAPLVVQPRRAVLAVQFELQQLLPYGLTDAAWHYAWWPDGPGPSVGRTHAVPEVPRTALVVAARALAVQERLQACRRAGLRLKAVSASPVALWNLWSLQREAGAAEARVALLHVRSAQSAEWVVPEGGGLQVIPLAGSTPVVVDAAAAWEGFAQRPRVWVLGAAASCRVFQDALAAKGAVVEWFDPTRLMTGLSTRIVSTAGGLPALGLALQGAGLPVPLPLNLVQGQQVRQQQALVRRVASALTGLLLALAVGLAGQGMWRRYRAEAAQLALLQEQERTYQALRPEAKTLLQQQQDLQARTAALEAVLAQKTQMPQLVADLVAALPDDVWLTSLQGSKGEALSALLEGRAASFPQVTEYFERLKRLGRFTTVKPLATHVTTEDATGKEMIAFSVQVQRAEGAP